jgi:hypothetical protein
MGAAFHRHAQPPPQKACAWWVVTKGAAANSTNTAAIAMTLRAIVLCLVDIVRTFLVHIVVYEYYGFTIFLV